MGQYYTRYFINDAGTIWSGQAFVRDWSDYSWVKSYEPTPPSGYYEIVHEDNREQYSAVIQKTQSVDNTEGELNNSFSQSNYIELNTVVSGNLSSSNDVDSYFFQVFEPGALTISIRLDPAADIGSSTRFSTTLLHDFDGDGYLRDDEVYLQADFGESSIKSINLNDTGYFYFQVEKGAYHTSNEYRFIVEGEMPAMTYIIPEGGRSFINHTGKGATVQAGNEVVSSDGGIAINNSGTGSTIITATELIQGGYDQNQGDIDGIYASNENSAKDLLVAAKDVLGFDDGIEITNDGTGVIDISLSGDVTVTTSTLNSSSQTAGYNDWSHHYGILASNYGTDIEIATTGDVTSIDRGIYAINFGSGNTSVTSSGNVYASLNQNDENYNQAGIEVYNSASAHDVTISARNVEALTHGIYAKNLGSGSIEVSVTGTVVGRGSGSEGIHTAGSAATIVVASTAYVKGAAEGIETDGSSDIVTVEGSVKGLSGTAILLGAGNDTVTIGSSAIITGIVDGGIGSDRANFLVAKSSVDGFVYNDETNTATVTVGNQITTFKDFEYFKFSDDTSAMATADVASTVTNSATTESLGPISALNTGSGTNISLDFYVDPSIIPEDVSSFDLLVSFDRSGAEYVSADLGDFLGFPNVSGDTITLSGISLTGVSSSDPLFTLNFADLDIAEELTVSISDVVVNGTSLDGSTLLIGGPDTVDVATTVISRSGTSLSDVALSFDDGSDVITVNKNENGLSTASITSGSDLTVTGSLDYAESSKSVTSQDALDALRLSVGMDTQSGTSNAFDYISADFNQDGKVSSQDALAILKYAVGLPTAEQANWVFVDSDGDYANISRTNTNYAEGITIADLAVATELSLTGILIGDVNDSYSGFVT